MKNLHLSETWNFPECTKKGRLYGGNKKRKTTRELNIMYVKIKQIQKFNYLGNIITKKIRNSKAHRNSE